MSEPSDFRLPEAPGRGTTLFVTDLQVEGLEEPKLIDTAKPRFSWKLKSELRSIRQAAFQLEVQALLPNGMPDGAPVTSELIESDQTLWVTLHGLGLSPNTRYAWKVRIWDNKNRDSGWSASAGFETGLLAEKWLGDWISDGRKVARKEDPPARYFKRGFTLKAEPVKARLYLSAMGIVEPWLNGKRVSGDYFTPGWPDYRKRNFYVAYDVTDILRRGVNNFGLVLGDGWYSGTLFLGHQYGETPKVSGWIEMMDTDGETTAIATDDSWEWAEGPIRTQGIYFGETYDARRENADWAGSTNGSWEWFPAIIEPSPDLPPEARYSHPVRRIEEMKPVSRVGVRPRVFVFDLGQNMVGWVRLKVQAIEGQEIKMRFAEMLDLDGGVYTGNLREAEATARYIAKGKGVESWEPRFSFFGFRYVELSGLENPLDDAITGVVVHSDLPRIGHFECSNALLNQLYSNTLWGQKGNFLEIPTDCPQRDERLGWTGDAQVFCNTANYNYASGPFYSQWLKAVNDSFEDGPEGGFGAVAPFTGFNRGAAGWSDAGVIVPWITWIHTADRKLLENSFGTVQRWINLQQASAPDGIRISKEGWGDWLAPGYEPKKAPTPYVMIATAYFAYSTKLAAHMAEVLGKNELAAQNHALFQQTKKAFAREYISDDGRILSDEQTAYLLALAFQLAPEDLRTKMVKHLEAAIVEKDFHLSTGFIGTPLLAPVLTEIGLTELAYKVILQETYPGWLFSVKNGATTIWERWDGWMPEVGFNSGGMNSFNHYAYGSVVEWFYGTIAGIKPDPDYPGWKRFTIAPIPGGGLTHAKARLQTPYGKVSSSWKIINHRFEFEVEIPANTQATIAFPAASLDEVKEGGKPLGTLSLVSEAKLANGRISLGLASGKYRFISDKFE